MPGIRLRRARLIGLTGLAGSGKTTVAEVFSRMGARVIDADRVGHGLLRKNSPCYGRLVNTFGPAILKDSGAISHSKLGEVVFSDGRQLARLNRIVHPRLVSEIIRRAGLLMREQPFRPVVIDAALIIPWGLDRRVDRLVVVEAPRPVRLSRLMGRGLTRERARKILQAQPRPADLRRKADLVIANRGSMAELRRKAERAWRELARDESVGR